MMIIRIIIIHQKVSRLLKDIMENVFNFRLKLVLFIKVRSYYVITLMHAMLKSENYKCKVIIIIKKIKTDKIFTYL